MTDADAKHTETARAPGSSVDAPVVVVTGASAGLGRAIAIAFAKRGWKVGLIARDPHRLEDAAADCRKYGSPDVLALPGDVAEWEAISNAAKRAEGELGPIRAWVNSAMVTVFSRVSDMKPDEFKRVTDVTYLGQVHGTMAALRHMRPRDTGSIILVGSALAWRGIPLQAAYCGAKFALRGFLDSLRSELVHDGSGIHVGMVQMPAINTPQFEWARSRLPMKPRPVPPIFDPEVCAEAVVRAVYEKRRELWVGTSSIKVIAGSMAAPGDFMDRQMAQKAFKAQVGEVPDPPDRPDNLDRPVSGDFGTHGRFDREARSDLVRLDPDVARRTAGMVIGGIAAVLGYLSARGIRR